MVGEEDEDRAAEPVASKLVWTALIAGFTLSSVIAGLLFREQESKFAAHDARFDRYEVRAIEIMRVMRDHENTAGHPAALAMIRAHENQVTSVLDQFEKRLVRIESAIECRGKTKSQLGTPPVSPDLATKDKAKSSPQ